MPEKGSRPSEAEEGEIEGRCGLRVVATGPTEALSRHILPTSGTMVGVCATLIGLVKIAEARIGPSRVDEYAALTAVLFLASALLSYVSIRHAEKPRLSRRCEAAADIMFLIGLVSISIVSVLFAYEFV